VTSIGSFLIDVSDSYLLRRILRDPHSIDIAGIEPNANKHYHVFPNANQRRKSEELDLIVALQEDDMAV
jgi:hypothetical protein